jgi:hypothetical protein
MAPKSTTGLIRHIAVEDLNRELVWLRVGLSGLYPSLAAGISYLVAFALHMIFP